MQVSSPDGRANELPAHGAYELVEVRRGAGPTPSGVVRDNSVVKVETQQADTLVIHGLA